jgi:hypothetical protein
MQDRWYGDNRDLVKWGTLLELARIYQVKQILQVLYLRPNTWDHDEFPQIEVGGEKVDITKEVIQHFRNVNLIRNLKSPVTIEVLNSEFQDRQTYLQQVVDAIKGRVNTPSIIFLDPDTGLQPQFARPDFTHVLNEELASIWRSLSANDVLVFYQHKTGMNNRPWIEPKLNQFVNALGVDSAEAKYAHAPTFNTANDVAFFYAKKE